MRNHLIVLLVALAAAAALWRGVLACRGCSRRMRAYAAHLDAWGALDPQERMSILRRWRLAQYVTAVALASLVAALCLGGSAWYREVHGAGASSPRALWSVNLPGEAAAALLPDGLVAICLSDEGGLAYQVRDTCSRVLWEQEYGPDEGAAPPALALQVDSDEIHLYVVRGEVARYECLDRNGAVLTSDIVTEWPDEVTFIPIRGPDLHPLSQLPPYALLGRYHAEPSPRTLLLLRHDGTR